MLEAWSFHLGLWVNASGPQSLPIREIPGCPIFPSCAFPLPPYHTPAITNMDPQLHSLKMASVDADQFESVGYSDTTRMLYIKFRNAPPLRFEGVPRFRYQGLLSAPRKDAYFKTFIKDQFLSRSVELPPPSGKR